MSTDSVQFEPLTRRGLFLGLRTAQLVMMLAGVVLGLAIAGLSRNVVGGILAVLVVIGAAGLGLGSWGRRNWDQWLALGGRWGWRALRGRNRWWSRYPLLGIYQTAEGEQMVVQDPPSIVGNVELVEVALDAGGDVGVIREADGESLIVIFWGTASGFMFSDDGEQRAAVGAFSAVMERVAQRETAFTGFQILERSLPALGDNAARELAAVPAERQRGAAFESYRELVEFQGSSPKNAPQEHEVYVALKWSRRKASRRIYGAARAQRDARRARAKAEEAREAKEQTRRESAAREERATWAVLLEDVSGVEQEFEAHGRVTASPLSSRGVAAVVRKGFNPGIRGILQRRAFLERTEAGLAPASAWPLECESEWDCFRSEGVWHRTYWIREWPAVAQSWDWIGGLLLRTGVGRTLSVSMRPVDPEVALARVGSAQVLDEAAAREKVKRGFRFSKREERQLEGASRREELLGQGRASFVFNGYVTVSAESEHELDARCEGLRAQAVKARVELQLLVGQQDEAFVWGSLPLVRGVKAGRV